MGVKEDLEAVLERTPRTPEDAEAMQEAASILASYLRLEEQVARLSGRSKRGEEAVRDQGSLRGLTLHEAARRVLLRAGVPLHARELGTRIKAGGWTHPRSRVARPEQIVFQLAARLLRTRSGSWNGESETLRPARGPGWASSWAPVGPWGARSATATSPWPEKRGRGARPRHGGALRGPRHRGPRSRSVRATPGTLGGGAGRPGAGPGRARLLDPEVRLSGCLAGVLRGRSGRRVRARSTGRAPSRGDHRAPGQARLVAAELRRRRGLHHMRGSRRTQGRHPRST